MKKMKLVALMLALTLAVMPAVSRAENTTAPTDTSAPATDASAPATDTSAPATDASAPATDASAPATDTSAPATDASAPATDASAPATDTSAPATDTSAPATDTSAPATDTPAPTATPDSATATPRPSYPRAWFDASMAIVDASSAYQGGRLTVALPIAIETPEGARVYSNAAGSLSGWTPQSDSSPFYFSQDIMALPVGAGWELDSASGAALDALFNLSAASVRDMIAYAPENNDWNMAANTPYNAGYAVFNLDVSESAPVGRYQLKFVYDGGDELMNEQKIEFTLEFSIAANPDVTPTPTIAPTDSPTDEPTGEPTDEPSGEGTVMIGQMAVETLKVGQSGVTLAIPVSYADDITRVYSNRDDDGNVLKPGSEGFSEEILNYIERLDIEITSESAADPTFPFMLSEQGVSRAVIADGVNYGYAVFSNLTVKSSLSNGTVAVPFTARYTDAITGETQTVELSALVNITGARSSSGGGGGSSSYVAPTTAPQARVIVESISTDPQDVQAGDSFDLVLKLRNTSEKQYVQNMRVTIDTENDVLIPRSGSNTVYIDKIDAQGLYELRYPVRANLEVPDRPLKVEVSIEYEDSAVSAQTAAQQLVVSVGQKMRLSVSEPVMDASSLYAGDSLDVTLQVVNEGRTTLYNVAVTPESASENLTLPTAAYLGNMEGGTSKKAELSLTPTKEGEYRADLIVSWEDALGEKYTEKRSVSFSAQADETIDYSGSTGGNPADYYSSDISGSVDIESETDASAIMSMMPWWVYAAAAGLYFIIAIYAAMSVRARRRKALEDDEMD